MTNIEIIRIPSGYHNQIKFLPDKDVAYIFKSLFAVANGEKIIPEESMRFGLLSSIFRETNQMNNKARAKKKMKPLKIDLATLSRDEGVRPNNITSRNITSNKETEKNVPKEISECEENPFEIIINHLNEKTNSKYKHTTEKTKTLINARINEGFTVDDFKHVIDVKTEQWLNTDMSDYLRPETLFSNKFEGYLNQKKKTTYRDKPKSEWNEQDWQNKIDDSPENNKFFMTAQASQFFPKFKNLL